MKLISIILLVILINLYQIAYITNTDLLMKNVNDFIFLGFTIGALIFVFSEKLKGKQKCVVNYCAALSIASSSLLIVGAGYFVLLKFVMQLSQNFLVGGHFESHRSIFHLLFDLLIYPFKNIFAWIGLNGVFFVLAIVTYESVNYCWSNRKILIDYLNK